MEMLRRYLLAIAQRLVHCAIAVSTAVFGRVTKTMSIALLLTKNRDLLLLSWCLMSSDVIWHIRDKLWPMPKHGSIRKVYACLAVTCHLHFWQNDRDFLRATVVTRGWNGYRNKSQHRKSTLEKKILPPFQQGFEPATFQSRVRCSNHWAIPAPKTETGQALSFIPPRGTGQSLAGSVRLERRGGGTQDP